VSDAVRGARDTIVAVASPGGAALRGVVRLSGARAREVVAARLVGEFPERRGAWRVRFLDTRGEQPALMLWMPGPASYTREDVIELHLVGNPELLRSAIEALLSDGVRRAQPGEFTRRAFEHGRLDLTRAEGVLELVGARNERERRAATALLTGGLADRVVALREQLDSLRALCEASLDFDEADTGHIPREELLEPLERAAEELGAAVEWVSGRPARRSLPRVLLVGAPNAGKSSLFNRLAGGAALPALVSGQAGTTRDALAAEVESEAGRFELLDLAGLTRGASADVLDAAGQARARALLPSADLVLWVVRADRPDLEGLAVEAGELPEGPVIGVWSQVDRPGARAHPPGPECGATVGWVRASSVEAEGTAALAAAIAERLAADGAAAGVSLELAEAHRAALERSGAALGEARELAAAAGELDLVAGCLRAAVGELDELVGHTSPEDLLDRIFSRFCIGK
jgi:tRNA modification GTPase